ncbi:MAG: aspartate aminotransferase family protein [Chloroflexi bacterium]|nr:MAG: aspartate aminotransferase family protein [Chloroflexota bacterium]
MITALQNVESVVERYRQGTPRSRELFNAALRTFPGGNSRTSIYLDPYPYYFESGSGCRIRDADGVERLDFINNYSALILGHAHPRVVAALSVQAARGTCAAAPSELEIRLGQKIQERLPSMQLLRFTNSGTEATMMALRVARAFTGRDLIVKFRGGYHGTHDYAAVNAAAAAGVVGGGSESDAGIPSAVSDTVIVLPFNERTIAERALTINGNRIAALIVEPVIGAGGVIPPEEGFLEFLREITRDLGILLIFDEVIAFRLSYNGAQGYFGVSPDLTALGKIIGGGLPIGAFGGRAEIMEQLDPRRDNYIGHGGTFNANPMSLVAGLATLQELTPDIYALLARLGDYARTRLENLFHDRGLKAQVTQVGSLFNIHFTDRAVRNYEDVLRGNRTLQKTLALALFNDGVVFTGRGMGCLSTPMVNADIDTFVDAVDQSLDSMHL